MIKVIKTTYSYARLYYYIIRININFQIYRIKIIYLSAATCLIPLFRSMYLIKREFLLLEAKSVNVFCK